MLILSIDNMYTYLFNERVHIATFVPTRFDKLIESLFLFFLECWDFIIHMFSTPYNIRVEEVSFFSFSFFKRYNSRFHFAKSITKTNPSLSINAWTMTILGGALVHSHFCFREGPTFARQCAVWNISTIDSARLLHVVWNISTILIAGSKYYP